MNVEKMDANILAIIGMGLTVTIFLLGIIGNWIIRIKNRISSNIETLCNRYYELMENHKDSGIHALSVIGIETLKTDKAIRKLVKRIELVTGKNPFGKQAQDIQNINLLRLFKYIRINKVNVLKVEVKEIIRNMKNQPNIHME